MVWSFFRSSHGKGVHDGASVVLKQEIYKEQLGMNPCKLQNASDVVAFCQRRQQEEHVVYPSVRAKVHRYFHLVKLENVDRRAN
jgi:hypothetical protein